MCPDALHEKSMTRKYVIKAWCGGWFGDSAPTQKKKIIEKNTDVYGWSTKKK